MFSKFNEEYSPALPELQSLVYVVTVDIVNNPLQEVVACHSNLVGLT